MIQHVIGISYRFLIKCITITQQRSTLRCSVWSRNFDVRIREDTISVHRKVLFFSFFLLAYDLHWNMKNVNHEEKKKWKMLHFLWFQATLSTSSFRSIFFHFERKKRDSLRFIRLQVHIFWQKATMQVDEMKTKIDVSICRIQKETILPILTIVNDVITFRNASN